MNQPVPTVDLSKLPKHISLGLIYSAGSMLAFPKDVSTNINLMGVRIPWMAVTTLSGALGSIGGDLLRDVNPLSKANASASMKLGAANATDILVSGAVSSAVMMGVGGIPSQNLTPLLLYSVLANGAGEWIFDKVLSNNGYNIL